MSWNSIAQAEMNVCKYFPGTAQSWNKDKSEFHGNHRILVSGSPIINNKHYLGFSSVLQDNNPSAENKFCDGNICYPASENSHLYAKEKDFSDMQSWPLDGDHWGNYIPDAGVIKPTQRRYAFNTFDLTKQEVIVPNGTVIYTKRFNMAANSYLSAESGKPDDLIIYVDGDSESPTDITSLSKGSTLKGLLYSKAKVDMSNGLGEGEITQVYGSVTAPDLIMNGSSSTIKTIIHGQSKCFEPPKPIYELAITLAKQSPTLCDEQIVTFNVTPDIEKADIAVFLSMVSGGQYSVDGKTFIDIPTDTISLPVQNNKAQLWLRSNDAGNVTINAHLSSDESVKANSNYDVLPADKLYLVASTVNDHIVAGKPFDVDVEVKQCSADFTQKTATHFNGNVTSVSTDYIQPKSGNVKAEWDNSPVKITNGKGEKSLKLHYSDAGKIQLKVNANGVFEDKKGNKQDITLTSNGLDLYFRPWTFAVCPLTLYSKDKIRTADGTASGGEKFTQAGAPFDVLLKPLVWVESLDKPKVNNEYNMFAQEYCEASVTENFLANDAPSIDNLKVSATLDSPKNGVLGDFYSGDNQVKNTILKGIVIQHNHWDDVGSINYHVRLDNYMGFDDMDVDPSYCRIGRFYPAYFQLENNSVTPAINGFTYMNQPFGVSFNIGAYNNNGKIVTNYNGFARTLQNTFIPEVVYGNAITSEKDNRLKEVIVPLWSKIFGDSIKFSSDTVKFIRKKDVDFIPKEEGERTASEPDGPYKNWQLFLRIKPLPTSDNLENPEVVDWKDNTNIQLVGTNDLRYGRMVLDDASGDLNQTLTIPLRVEYWNGSEFVTNTDDSISRFDGANYCYQVIQAVVKPNISTPVKPPYTDGEEHTVFWGRSSSGELLAHPINSLNKNEIIRQKIRFWQRLSKNTTPNGAVSRVENILTDKSIVCPRETNTSNQPWLSYNWRDFGDEDPSATVTFGVYHGNDRIIYRDEVNKDNKPIPYVDYQ
ncbi:MULTISPECIES: DUF6701 domain-containing protein [unclassified Photobacterium]|uniref:DUF6701 domain-containing protein n=1 Tax=unclassified Photobacterium TaxID=2628852 RepID=UPI001EDE242F|nr:MULTISPECIES: DUF6701 domain-containing protein [unclassified Photobacterium]MCG3862832.1 hypothetical protein [Photobacterium sp. Ph6]MCG3874303.1 hypothetical protein [Photobacterium sp. Ph5]